MSAVSDDLLFRMPTLGADMTEGRVVEWLVEPGQEVQRGDVVAVIDTDKSDIEIEVFEPCVFDEFLVEIDETVEVGTPIARIRPVDASTTTRPSVASTSRPGREAELDVIAEPGDHVEPAAVSHPIATAEARRPERPARDSRHRLTPRARRLAAEQGVSFEQLPRFGIVAGDAVEGADIAKATNQRPSGASTPARADGARAASLRRVIADRMQRAWAEIPHYHVTDRLDVTALLHRLNRHNDERSAADRVVVGAVLNAAIARAVADVPELNGWWRDGAMQRSERVDLGFVVSLRGGGIVVPVVAAADELDIDEMMSAMRELVERARRGRLRPRDVGEASITVTNLGERGPAEVFGVIHPPQVALVGVGGLRDAPIVVDGNVVPARVVHVTVAGDHRAHDGAAAARLLERINHHLEAMP